MKSSTQFKVAALVLILAVTISIKVAWLRADRPSDEKLQTAIVALLSRAGFSVERKTLLAGFEIIGRSGDCRLTVRDTFPQGYNLETIVAWTPKDAQLLYAFRGELYPEAPISRATAAHVWARVLRQFGLSSTWSPMVAVASTPTCTPSAIPWGELTIE